MDKYKKVLYLKIIKAIADSYPRAIAFHLTPTIGVNYDRDTIKKVRQITTKAVFNYPR
jgi:hypothetical protein